MGPKIPHPSALLAALLLVSLAPAFAHGDPSGPEKPISVSELSGVTFVTAGFAPLQQFYGHGAGLAEVTLGPDRIRFAVGSSQWVEFRKVPEASWTRRFQYVTLGATNLDQVEAELHSRGVHTTWVTSDSQERVLELADPAGNLIHVARPWAAPEDATGQSNAFSSHLQHMGMAVPRSLSESTIAFYRDVLGFPEAVHLNGQDARLALVKFRVPGPGRELIELIFCDPPINKWAAGAFDHINFEVSDIDATYQRLHKGGIATKGSHLPTVNGERLWAMDIFDPELTRMEIQVTAPTSTPIGTVSTVGGESATPMFDGRTLAGWEGNLKNWRVDDGAIVAGALDRRQPYNEFLATTEDYGDFELRLQYKVEGSGGFVNGGVQFWSQRVPGSFEVSGFQADLGADTDGNLYDESRRNSNLALAPADVRQRVLKPGDWNNYRIRAVGPHIEIWLNGVKTVDYTEKDPSVPLRGKFALQIHGYASTKVSYRHLEIETLP